MLVGAGSMAVLGCGMPLARAGDMGISVTCGSLAPPFEVFTGSSNVFVGGARAARLLDITKHCDPTTMGPFGIAMGIAGVAAGAAGAIATGQAAQAAQAAADAAVLALKLLAGKDPGLPPGIGALVGPPLPTVMIGGFPCPPIGDMAIGALMKGIKKLVAAAKKMRASRRSNANCGDGSHPIYLVTGENFDHFTDFVSPGLFAWRRRYTTAHAAIDGPLGYGFRHHYQRHLDVRLHQATFIDWDGVELEFPKFEGPPGCGLDELREHGYVLRRVSQGPTSGRYELSTPGQPTLVFEGDRFTEALPLVGLRSETHTLALEYDAEGRLAGAVDTPLGSRTSTCYRLSYDRAGRLTALHELGSRPTARFTCTYTEAGELHQARDACDGVWTYAYDAAHRWTSQTDPRGYSYSFGYDEDGRCVSASGQDGLWSAQVEYLPDKGMTRYTEGEGAVWEYHYDLAGFITSIVAPDGGERIRSIGRDGRVLADTDAGGRTLRYTYDADGAPLARIDEFGHVFPPEHEAPVLDDPFRRELPSTALARNFAGALRPWPEAVFGATGALLEIPAPLRGLAHQVFRLRPRGAPQAAPKTQVMHDALGRPVYAVEGARRAWRRSYDESGNEVARVDRDGHVYRSETTSWNLIGARIDPLGNTSRYEYSSLEQLTALTDPLGNTSRWDYDACRRLTRVWRYDRLRDTYEYDVGGHMIAKYDGADALVFRNAAFHDNHLVARRELASGGEHRFDYDARGRMTEVSTERHAVTRTFSPIGERLLDLRDGEGLERWVDDHGERVRILDRFEWTLRWARDGALELRVPSKAAVSRLRYASDGVVLIERANQTREWQQYDHEGRLEGVMTCRANARGETFGWGRRYAYSGEGDLLAIQDSVRGSTRYEVDAAHRLVAEARPDGAREAFVHDAANNLVHKRGLSRLAIASHNRASASATEVFEYDGRERLATRRHRDGAQTSYRYDSFDRLERLERRGTGESEPELVWRAAYDAIGRRLWVDAGGRRREFFWDGDRLAAEVDPEGRLRVYLYFGPDALVPSAFIDYDSRAAEPETGRLYQVYSDGVGQPLHIEDETREIVWWPAQTDPWGLITVHQSSTVEYNLRWPGHYYDPETGLHYNRHRYYDPALGRYLSPDPLGYAGSETNLYAYAPNPLVQVDVLGLAHDGQDGDATRRSSSDDNEGAEPAETPAQRRARQREQIEKMKRDRRRRIEAAEHAEIVDGNRQARDNGEFDGSLSPDDRAYINDETALSRASDPDKRLGDSSPGSTIDEARAMQHAEDTGQLPGPVDRSVRPGADVRTGTGDAEQHYSMKGVVHQDHPGSQARAAKEIDNMAGDRRRGSEPNGVLIDLRHSPDPVGDRQRLQAHANQVNADLSRDGHDPIDVRFIDP
nr:RHS repeat-associated core domain-containing protein [Pseudenhygromyxa sp. WMMC2535]